MRWGRSHFKTEIDGVKSGRVSLKARLAVYRRVVYRAMLVPDVLIEPKNFPEACKILSILRHYSVGKFPLIYESFAKIGPGSLSGLGDISN